MLVFQNSPLLLYIIIKRQDPKPIIKLFFILDHNIDIYKIFHLKIKCRIINPIIYLLNLLIRRMGQGYKIYIGIFLIITTAYEPYKITCTCFLHFSLYFSLTSNIFGAMLAIQILSLYIWKLLSKDQQHEYLTRLLHML